MVARGVGGDRVSPRYQREEQDAGGHKGPPNPSSSALAPTHRPASQLGVMPIGRSSGSPWQSNCIPGNHSQTLVNVAYILDVGPFFVYDWLGQSSERDMMKARM